MMESDRLVRKTSQRDAIQQAFADADRPLSPQEVLDAAKAVVPSIGIATVYRNIKLLVDQDELVPVQLPGESPRYEEAGKAHHHHFHCRKCDRVFEVDGCDAIFRRITPQGFRLESHDLTLSGLCADCAG
jgi:Fur family ferric uptake transcriptional regulator